MNTMLNITINNGPKEGFQNIHINEIHNIPDYSVDLLSFGEINSLQYSYCESAISLILNKIRPQTGLCIIEIIDMSTVCGLYINKAIRSVEMSNIISTMQNVFGVIDIKNLLDRSNNMFNIIKIMKHTEQNKIFVTIQRNSV